MLPPVFPCQYIVRVSVLCKMNPDPLTQEFLEALGRYEVRNVDVDGSEILVMVVQGHLMDAPRTRHRRVGQIRGSVVEAWYVQQQQQPCWVFAVEEAGSSRWLVFHTWSETRGQWEDRISLRILQQPRRGNRVNRLQGRRRLISYSLGLED